MWYHEINLNLALNTQLYLLIMYDQPNYESFYTEIERMQ